MTNQLDVDVDVAVQGADDLSKIGSSFDDVQTKASGFLNVAQGAIIGVSSAVAGFGIGLAKAGIDAAFESIGTAIELSSNKAEAASKAQILFADGYDQVAEASTNAATTVGVSSGKYLELAGNVGNLITNFGFAGDEAAGMATDIVQLSADVGSFNNAPTEDVVNAIGAAFRGETEPIRAFGVMLDDATVKAKAMELGLYDGVGALDKNAKATATYQLILEQTGKAQGDFARTSDGLANSQKIASARIEEGLTKIGDVIAPLAAELVPLLADAITNLIDNVLAIAGVIGDWIEQNQGLIDTIVNLVHQGFDALVAVVQTVLDYVGQLADLLSGPLDLAFGLIKGAIDLVAGALNFLHDAVAAVGDTFNDLHRAIDPNLASMQDFETKFRSLGEAAGLTEEQISTGWTQISTSVGNGTLAADTDLGLFVDRIKELGDTAEASDVGETLAQQAYTAAGAAQAASVDVATATQEIEQSWQMAASQAGTNAQGLRNAGDVVQDAMDELVDDIKGTNWQAIGALPPKDIAQGVVDHAKEVVDAADRLVELLLNGLTPEEQALKLIGAKYTNAVAEGMTSKIPGAKDAAIGVALAAINTIEDAGLTGAKGARGMEAIGKYYDDLLAGGLSSQDARLALTGAGVASSVIDGLEGKGPAFTAVGESSADKVAAGLDPNGAAWEHYGASIGASWIDGIASRVAAGKLEIARAVQTATRAMQGESPPREGPLRTIDVMGENIADAWIGGLAKGVMRGGDVLAQSLAWAMPGTASGAIAPGSLFGGADRGRQAPTIQVYTGVGDPVAIGREIKLALDAYYKASGTQA